MDDPKLTIDAVIEPESTDIAGISCKKITIARYAWLELVGSPFIDFEKKFTVSNLITSLYICQLDAEDLKKYSVRDVQKLEDAAMAWADGIDLDKIGPAVDFIMDQFKKMMKISPGTGSTEGDQKKTDAGTTTA